MERSVEADLPVGSSSWVGCRVRNPATGDEGTVSHVSEGDRLTLHVLLDSGATEDLPLGQGAIAPDWLWFDESTAGEERWVTFGPEDEALRALTLPELLARRGG
ncbi:MAG TPA: hypothetical protein VFX50_14415 [Gemmatimonadales bacterium]|nr:hypothetical protein [Gemmatimonadales bacterium]